MRSHSLFYWKKRLICRFTLLSVMKYNKDFKDLILLLPKGRNREASALRHFIAAVICSTCMAKSTLHTSSWAYKEKQDACQCSKRLTDAILFCWKNTWRNFFTRCPKAQQCLKSSTPLIGTHDAFSQPL